MTITPLLCFYWHEVGILVLVSILVGYCLRSREKPVLVKTAKHRFWIKRSRVSELRVHSGCVAIWIRFGPFRHWTEVDVFYGPGENEYDLLKQLSELLIETPK